MEATLSLVIIFGGSPCVWFMRTSVTLRRGRAKRFSKTAQPPRFSGRFPRPHCRQLDAMGRHDRPVPLAIVGRRLAHDLAEGAAEGPEAGEADVEADVGDTAVGFA